MRWHWSRKRRKAADEHLTDYFLAKAQVINLARQLAEEKAKVRSLRSALGNKTRQLNRMRETFGA